MSDRKQPETEQSGWLHEAQLWAKEQWCRILLGVLVIAISYCICSPYLSPERRATNNDHTRLVWYLIGLAVTGVVALCKPRIITSSPEKYFITRVLTTGITGGAFALLLPIAVKSTTTGVGGLRHSILLATGGLLAILTLVETRRKNDNDLKAANELQIRHKETLEQQKFQFDKQLEEQQKQFNASAFKERKAERRERYTKAVEQLGDEKAPVRMGGVYTLVGLVDEWLEEESIRKYEDRLKEGQVIINNLCAYIRSPFTLASHYDELMQDTPDAEGVYQDKVQEFYADKATLESEADVRLSIIKEIHDHLQGPEENTPGTWSDFEYDFSGSVFFYPVDLTKSYYKKPINFSGSVYEGGADFSGSTYEGLADFSSSIYEKDVTFSNSEFRSTYKDTANFSSSTYQGEAIFSKCKYEKSALFKESVYGNEVTFRESIYGHKEGNIDNIRIDFTNSIYRCSADFSWSEYNFNTLFNSSIYCNEVYFNYSTYSQGAHFSDSIYNQKIESCATTYDGCTTFYGSIFCNSVHFSTYFNGDGYENKPSKFTKHPPNFFHEFYDPDLDELCATYSIADDPHKGSSTATRALFGKHNNSFEVIQNEADSIDKNSNNLPIHCDFINSTQNQYIENTFKEINRIYEILITTKNLRKIKDFIFMLQCTNNQFHEWRNIETLTRIPYDLDKIFGSVLETSED